VPPLCSALLGVCTPYGQFFPFLSPETFFFSDMSSPAVSLFFLSPPKGSETLFLLLTLDTERLTELSSSVWTWKHLPAEKAFLEPACVVAFA